VGYAATAGSAGVAGLLTPTIAELSQAIEQEVEKCPAAERLRMHPGVGSLTALAFVLIIGEVNRFRCGKQVGPVIWDWCRWRSPAETGTGYAWVPLFRLFEAFTCRIRSMFGRK
jgi:transposase